MFATLFSLRPQPAKSSEGPKISAIIVTMRFRHVTNTWIAAAMLQFSGRWVGK